MYAVAEHLGTNQVGHQLFQVLNAADSELLGARFFATGAAPFSKYCLIRFYPEDQFCAVVSLDAIPVKTCPDT